MRVEWCSGTNMIETVPGYERIYGDIPKDWVPLPAGVETICPGGPRQYEDAGNMTETLVALRGFFPKDTVDTILKVTAGVMHIGNMEFEGDEDEFKSFVDSGTSGKAREDASHLWGVSAAVVWSW